MVDDDRDFQVLELEGEFVTYLDGLDEDDGAVRWMSHLLRVCSAKGEDCLCGLGELRVENPEFEFWSDGVFAVFGE